MNLYFATSIDNFNEIFSLEFLVPVKIFEEISLYRKSRFDLMDNYITFYEYIPKITKKEFVIKINIQDEENLTDISDGIYIYPLNFKIKPSEIIFFNKEMKDIIIGRCALISEIKNMNKYISKFISLDDMNVVESKEVIEEYFIENNKNNQVLNIQRKNINSYNKLLGGIYYSLFKNKAAIIGNKLLYLEYGTVIKITRLKDEIKKSNMLYKNIRYGFNNELKVIEKNINKLIKESNNFIYLNDNYNYAITNNYKFTCKNEELDMFNMIINKFCNNSVSIKEVMVILGEEIKSYKFEHNYLNEFRIVYDVCINGKIGYNFKDIKSVILRSLLVALLKYENISEIQDLCKSNDLSDSIYPYFFAGMIQGYANISKVIIDLIQSEKIVHQIVNNEIKNLENIMQNIGIKKLYKLILTLRSEEAIYRLRMIMINRQIKNLDIKKVNDKVLKFIINLDGIEYIIMLNKNKNNDFDKILEALSIKRTNLKNYKSFKVYKRNKNRTQPLNCIDQQIISEYIEELLKLIRLI